MSIELFENGRLREALTYDEYRDVFEAKAEADSAEELPEEDQEYFEYYRLNFGRSKRLEQNYTPSDRLRDAVQSIGGGQTWLVLTEPWCGDSAQILPVLAAAADLNDEISFRILLRDENLDIMDQYLTNGKRGIPKLVVFDAGGQELFTWGPRPQPAQDIFINGQAEGRERTDIYEEMQLWYNEDKGETVDAELAAAIEQVQKDAEYHSNQDSRIMAEEQSKEERERTEQDEYERRVEEQIEEWENKIDDLKERVEKLQDSLKKEVDRESSRYEKELDSLKVKRDAAKRLLAELSGASGKAWSGFQKELGDALEGAGAGLQRLADRLRKRTNN